MGRCLRRGVMTAGSSGVPAPIKKCIQPHGSIAEHGVWNCPESLRERSGEAGRYFAPPIQRVHPDTDLPDIVRANEPVQVPKASHVHFVAGLLSNDHGSDGIGLGFCAVGGQLLELEVAHEVGADPPCAGRQAIEHVDLGDHCIETRHERSLVELGGDISGKAAPHHVPVTQVGSSEISRQYVLNGRAVEEISQVRAVCLDWLLR